MSQLQRHREPPRIIPPHNLYGDHGPRCPRCSGLGSVLQLGSSGAPTKSASRCLCGGTGVDKDLVRDREMSSLLQRIDALEKQIRFKDPLIASMTKRSQGKCSRQYWEELIAWATADGTSVNTTTTETIVFPNVTIPANYMSDGRLLAGKLQGKHSTLGSGTVTVLWTIRWGGVAGTILCKSAAMTQLISLTNAYWEIEYLIQTRSNGATGTVMANGVARVFGATAPTIGSATGAPAVAPMTVGGQTGPAAVTADLSADAALSVTVTMGASSASNIVIGHNYGLESRN